MTSGGSEGEISLAALLTTSAQSARETHPERLAPGCVQTHPLEIDEIIGREDIDEIVGNECYTCQKHDQRDGCSKKHGNPDG